MNVEVEKQGSCYCKLTIALSVEEVESAYAQAVRKVAKSANVPGYRPGKLPKGMLERQFAGAIEQNASEQLVQDNLFKAIAEAGISPIATPSLQSIDIKRGATGRLVAGVEIRPDIVLKQITGLSAPEANVDIADEQVTQEIDKLRQQQAETVPVTDRTTVQTGDFVLLDYKGYLGDEAFTGGSAENALIEIGGGEYIPGFAEGIVGKEVPGTYDIDVQFPEDFGNEQLKGKPARFSMTLHEIKTRELPALDDAFAKDMGKDDLASLKDGIRADLKQRAEREVKSNQRRGLLQSLVAANPTEVPTSMVDRQIEHNIENMQARMQQALRQKYTFNADELADMRSNGREEAEFMVRSALLLMAVAKQESIEVDDAAVAARIAEIAKDNDNDPRVTAFYSQEEHNDELRYSMVEDRVVETLLSTAKLEKVVAKADDAA